MAASEVKKDGQVFAPLNILAPAPLFSLNGFQWTTVDEKIHGPQAQEDESIDGQQPSPQAPLIAHVARRDVAQPVVPTGTLSEVLNKQLHLDEKKPGAQRPAPPPFPLTEFHDAFAGNGFNMIFRPRFNKDKSVPGSPEGPTDNILELNLTTDQITFGPTLGEIPNRGLGDQPDITLGGLPYLQTVQDVTNIETGKGDSPEVKDIHFEPGVWLLVPAASFHKKNVASVVRMASIPHGTTINAQGLIPTRGASKFGGVAGPPVIDDIDTTPFPVGGGKRLVDVFPSMDASRQETFRIPQNLSKFNDKGTGTITTEIIKNPNLVLKNAIKGQNIKETITFEISTGPPGPPTAELNGGGTANISFLAGKQDPVTSAAPGRDDQPIAHAGFMSSKVWIEQVEYKVRVPKVTTQTVLQLMPIMPDNSTAPTPVFDIIPPPGGIPAQQVISVLGTQIQISQIVNLSFKGLIWPHVSVSTLVPKRPQVVQMS